MRGLTSGQIAVVTGETVRRAFALEMEFDSGTSRVVTAPYDITIDGDTFVGGVMAEISSIDEVSDLAAAQMTAVLSGIPPDAITIAYDEPYQGRRVTVWFVPMDDNWAPIAPYVLFRGRIDQMQIEVGDTAKVTATFTNRLAAWETPKVMRYSDEDQQQRNPGDFFFQYAASMENKEVTWPNKIRMRREAAAG